MQGRPTTVLLVEDDDDNRELMGEVLVGEGYDVVPAASGAEAVRILGGRAVDVVVTDVGMPGVSGLEVARAAKANGRKIPVVIVTGWAEREDIAQAKGRDVDAVLIKPVDPDALAAAVGAAVQNGGRR
jgi:CheY-like chemotaxis protein